MKIGFENIIKGSRACGIEVILLSEGLCEFNLTILKKEKSLLKTDQKITGIKSFEELSQIVDSKIPVVLVFNGKGIVHRKVSHNENDTLATLLNKTLPNANANDFYLQRHDVNQTVSFISIIRSSLIDEAISKLKEHNITNIVSFLLGPFVVETVLPLLDTSVISDEKLSFAGYELLIREDQINDFSLVTGDMNPNLVPIGDEKTEPRSLISFSAALSYFTKPLKGIENSALVNTIKEEFKQKQKFQFAGWALLIITLFILLVNYLVFNNYWEKGNELASELAVNQSSLTRYDQLKKEYLQKKEFLEANGLLENSQTSFYADRLAENLPSSIQWLDLNIHPLKKKEANDESVALFFENKKILITGKCQRNTELNEWMKKMKKKDWVADVTLINYKQENAADAGIFFLEIQLK